VAPEPRRVEVEPISCSSACGRVVRSAESDQRRGACKLLLWQERRKPADASTTMPASGLLAPASGSPLRRLDLDHVGPRLGHQQGCVQPLINLAKRGCDMILIAPRVWKAIPHCGVEHEIEEP
jgi:hypothetical protein